MARAFANLRGDATLIAPGPTPATAPCVHLLAFLRQAPRHQTLALFARVGVELESRWAADPSPVWLSTSGLGVSWLHVRLDARPRYYTHAPYRTPPEV